MSEFIGGGAKTLIVEADDATYERHDRAIKQFPGNTTVRAKSADEARKILAKDSSFDMVSIDGRVWTPEQALPRL